MKKLTCIALIVMMILVCLASTVYAAPECTVSLQTPKSEFEKGEEFTLDVNISRIKSERGIIALQATLDYDKDSLELKKMEGQNDWMTPVKDLSYNESNGKLVLDKNGLAKNDETILKITFKVKDTAKKDLTVSLKDISISDVTTPLEIAVVSKNIKIKEASSNQGQSGTSTKVPDKNSSDTYKGKLPQTGAKEGTILVIGGVALTLGIACFVKMKKM